MLFVFGFVITTSREEPAEAEQKKFFVAPFFYKSMSRRFIRQSTVQFQESIGVKVFITRFMLSQEVIESRVSIRHRDI